MSDQIKMYDVLDDRFRKYGRVIKEYDCSELIKKMEETPIPSDVIYVPSEPEMEALELFNELQEIEFGGLPIQLGYCNGNNILLNAVEYHRSSEINVAVTDMILLLGSQQDIDPDKHIYDTSLIEAFFIPAGTMIEVYATTLHYAPCNAKSDGFRCVVILPRGTNQSLETNQIRLKDRLLFAKNKWLIAHPDTDLGRQGAFVGLVGKNISVED